MIVKEEFLKKLRSAFDLNIYEVKIWTALLSKGVATAGELSDISNVPRSRSYDILESLEKKGFIIMKLGKPIKYLAVKPHEVIKRVRKGISEEADVRIDLVDKIDGTDFFNELELLYKNGIAHVDITSLSGVVKGRNNLYNHIETILGDAKEYVIVMTSAKEIKRKSDVLAPILKKLSDKKIKVKIATQVDAGNEEAVKRLSKYADIKHIPHVKARFVVVDGKQVLFMVNDDEQVHESYDSGIWVNSELFGGALTSLFSLTWSTAK